MTRFTQTGSSSPSSVVNTSAASDDPTGSVKALNVAEFENSEAYLRFAAEQKESAAAGFRSARWLDAVLRRLETSIGINGETPNGEWLDRQVVEKARTVFRTASDLLPSEPHLSSSREGNLVAEFSSRHGPLSMVISPKAILLFAMFDGKECTRSLSALDLNQEQLRATIVGLAQEAGVTLHGQMESW